jgi:integrase
MGRRDFGNVRKLPSGRWQAGYWFEGKRHIAAQTFPTKADASKWLSTVETSIIRGEWLDPAGSKTTVEDLTKRWLSSNTRKRASSSARDDAILRVHVLPAIGKKRIGSVNPADVQAMVDGWAEHQAASTVGRQYSAVRAMFAHAVNSDLIGRTPCRGIRVPQASLVDRPEPDPEALERLAEALGVEWAPFMWLGAVGGLRWAEVAGLTVGDLDLLAGRITVSRQLSRVGTFAPPKTKNSARSFALDEQLVADLAALLARRGLNASNPADLVFTTKTGTPLSYTNWRRRVWVPACETAKLGGLRFHDLRSMAASALVAAGVDVKTAQTRLGHSSPSVTLGIYARMTADADRAAASAVGGFFRVASRTQRARPIDGTRKAPSEKGA